MSLLHITQENFDSLVMQAPSKVLLDFWATWCGPCQMIAPIIDQIAQEHSSVTVGKINVDEEMPLAIKFNISSIPTLVLMENGAVKAQLVGLHSLAEIEKLLEK